MACTSRWGFTFTSREGFRWPADRRGVRNPDLAQLCAPVLQEFAKHRPVAAGFVFAVAADRQVCVMRESRHEIKRPPRRWHIHLRFEGADEAFPFGSRDRSQGLRYQLGAGGEVGIPDVEPIVGRIAFLANAARRTPHRADPNSLVRMAGFTQADDPQGHDAPIALKARVGLLSVCRPAGPIWANG